MGIIYKPELFKWDAFDPDIHTKTVGHNRTVSHIRAIGQREIVGTLHGYPVFRVVQYDGHSHTDVFLNSFHFNGSTTMDAISRMCESAGIPFSASCRRGDFSIYDHKDRMWYKATDGESVHLRIGQDGTVTSLNQLHMEAV